MKIIRGALWKTMAGHFHGAQKKPSFKLQFERRPVAGAKAWQWHDATNSSIISCRCSSVKRMGLFLKDSHGTFDGNWRFSNENTKQF